MHLSDYTTRIVKQDGQKWDNKECYRIRAYPKITFHKMMITHNSCIYPRYILLEMHVFFCFALSISCVFSLGDWFLSYSSLIYGMVNMHIGKGPVSSSNLCQGQLTSLPLPSIDFCLMKNDTNRF